MISSTVPHTSSTRQNNGKIFYTTENTEKALALNEMQVLGLMGQACTITTL